MSITFYLFIDVLKIYLCKKFRPWNSIKEGTGIVEKLAFSPGTMFRFGGYHKEVLGI